MKTRVDFLIAGNQKCGTTTLHQLLSQHPDTRMSEPKEMHFFDERSFDSSEAAYAEYHRRGWGTDRFDDRAVYGESTPKYACVGGNRRALYLDRIVEYHPDVKLILLFRDPIERALSQWSMLRRNRDDIPSFTELIDSLLDDDTNTEHRDILRRGHYGSIVFNVLARFPSDHCLFITPADINEHLDHVCRFIGVGSYDFEPLHLNVHDDKDPIDPELLARLRDYYRAEIDIFGRLTGTDVRHWLD